jgi:hypothetical protein
MKKMIIEPLIVGVIVAILGYFCISFWLWEMNPKNWDGMERFMLILLFSVGIYGTAMYNDMNKSKK